MLSFILFSFMILNHDLIHTVRTHLIGFLLFRIAYLKLIITCVSFFLDHWIDSVPWVISFTDVRKWYSTSNIILSQHGNLWVRSLIEIVFNLYFLNLINYPMSLKIHFVFNNWWLFKIKHFSAQRDFLRLAFELFRIFLIFTQLTASLFR